MIVRELLTRIGYKVDKSAEKKVNASFDRLKRGAQAVAAALVTGVVAQGFKRMVDAASDVQETMNVVTTAFEDQTQAVLQWAKASGEASGRSEYAMRQYAATLGAVVGPTLGSAEATAELSTNMAQLAVDLGSFFNATDQEALDALRSGLIGQAEPLLRFGVAMNVAALDAFALEKGLGKSTKQMSQAEKIQLRYRFILDRTAKAQGDAARTSDGYANLTKRLSGNVYDLQVALGETLLPAAVEIIKAMSEAAKVLKGPLKAALGAVVDAVKVVGALFIGFYEASALAKVGMIALAGALALVATGSKKLVIMQALMMFKFLLIGAIVAAIIIILQDLWKGITKGEGVLAGMVKEFQALAKENDSYTDAVRLSLQNALDHWIWYFTGVENGSWRMGESIRGAFRALGEWIGGFFGGLAQHARDHWNTVVDIALTALEKIATYISDEFQPILDAFQSVIDGISEGMLGLVGMVSDLGLGDLAKTFGLAGPEQINVPGSPAAAAAAGGVNANQTIEVNVNAPNGDGPAIANAVAPAVGRAAGDANRRTAQQLLVGGAS
jgi:hypothetical protein